MNLIPSAFATTSRPTADPRTLLVIPSRSFSWPFGKQTFMNSFPLPIGAAMLHGIPQSILSGFAISSVTSLRSLAAIVSLRMSTVVESSSREVVYDLANGSTALNRPHTHVSPSRKAALVSSGHSSFVSGGCRQNPGNPLKLCLTYPRPGAGSMMRDLAVVTRRTVSPSMK